MDITPMTRASLLCFSLVLGAFGCSGSGGDGDDDSGTGGKGGGTGGSAGANVTKGGTSGVGTGGTTGGSAGMSAGRGGAAGAGTGGTGGTGGSGAGMGGGATGGAGAAGKGGSAGMTSTMCTAWPTAQGAPQSVSATIEVSGVYDGGMKRFVGSGELGTSGQGEDQDPLFELSHGSTLRNVIIGSPAADGIHCSGNCTLENVWWEDVGEDAATFRGSAPSLQMVVRCGGARSAMDKVFQHNGSGTLTIQDFVVQDFGKLYRSCGNCSEQFERHVNLVNVDATDGGALVGINENYDDTATFADIGTRNVDVICERYEGNDTGAEPENTGEGADGTYCRYESSDIHAL
jgi:pectate lyase